MKSRLSLAIQSYFPPDRCGQRQENSVVTLTACVALRFSNLLAYLPALKREIQCSVHSRPSGNVA